MKQKEDQGQKQTETFHVHGSNLTGIIDGTVFPMVVAGNCTDYSCLI
jgi:hypothetical protein